MEELFLQILGAGRNDDALAGANDGHQVGQRLARAGAGFDDQVTLFFQRLLRPLAPSATVRGEIRRRDECAKALRPARRTGRAKRRVSWYRGRAEDRKARSHYNKRYRRCVCGAGALARRF